MRREHRACRSHRQQAVCRILKAGLSDLAGRHWLLVHAQSSADEQKQRTEEGLARIGQNLESGDTGGSLVLVLFENTALGSKRCCKGCRQLTGLCFGPAPDLERVTG